MVPVQVKLRRKLLREEVLLKLYDHFHENYPDSSKEDFKEEIPSEDKERLLAYKYLYDRGLIKFSVENGFDHGRISGIYKIKASIKNEGIVAAEEG